MHTSEERQDTPSVSLLPFARRYALQYLKSNWDRLREFDAAFGEVDIDEMRKAVQPLLVAEGMVRGCSCFCSKN